MVEHSNFSFFVNVEFEKLHFYCSHCDVIGHDALHRKQKWVHAEKPNKILLENPLLGVWSSRGMEKKSNGLDMTRHNTTTGIPKVNLDNQKATTKTTTMLEDNIEIGLNDDNLGKEFEQVALDATTKTNDANLTKDSNPINESGASTNNAELESARVEPKSVGEKFVDIIPSVVRQKKQQKNIGRRDVPNSSFPEVVQKDLQILANFWNQVEKDEIDMATTNNDATTSNIIKVVPTTRKRTSRKNK